MHELVIRGGDLVDGTGAPARRQDVAVDGDVVVALGSVGVGRREIDARGCIVTPGFIDPHTHYDAQVCWDPYLSPSNLHGVTTVMLGMCGFGVAPCRPGGGEYLLQSLEVVEEIPYEATRLGVPFTWSSYGEYLDFVDGLRPAVNVGGLVPHSALRCFVMGERGRSEPATTVEREAMVSELTRSLHAGAFGFATSRAPNHLDAFGQPVPSRAADDRELEALVMACHGRAWQLNIRNKASLDPEVMMEEIERYATWTRAARARLTWSPFGPRPSEHVWRTVLGRHRALNEDCTVAPQVASQVLSVMFSLERALPSHIEGWSALLHGFDDCDLVGRRERLRHPHVRAALRRGQELPGFSAAGFVIPATYDKWNLLASQTRQDLVGRTLVQIARDESVHPVDLFCDLALADDLSTTWQIPHAGADPEAIAALCTDEFTLIGLGDGGAHVRSISDYAYPTKFLAEMVRDDRRVGLEVAVRRLTRDPARFFGIVGRGTVEVGATADLCVLDLERLEVGPPCVREDLPGGAPRLWRAAVGYRAVVVNGEVAVLDDQPTGVRSGRTLRCGAQ